MHVRLSWEIYYDQQKRAEKKAEGLPTSRMFPPRADQGLPRADPLHGMARPDALGHHRPGALGLSRPDALGISREMPTFGLPRPEAPPVGLRYSGAFQHPAPPGAMPAPPGSMPAPPGSMFSREAQNFDAWRLRPPTSYAAFYEREKREKEEKARREEYERREKEQREREREKRAEHERERLNRLRNESRSPIRMKEKDDIMIVGSKEPRLFYPPHSAPYNPHLPLHTPHLSWPSDPFKEEALRASNSSLHRANSLLLGREHSLYERERQLAGERHMSQFPAVSLAQTSGLYPGFPTIGHSMMKPQQTPPGLHFLGGAPLPGPSLSPYASHQLYRPPSALYPRPPDKK